MQLVLRFLEEATTEGDDNYTKLNTVPVTIDVDSAENARQQFRNKLQEILDAFTKYYAEYDDWKKRKHTALATNGNFQERMAIEQVFAQTRPEIDDHYGVFGFGDKEFDFADFLKNSWSANRLDMKLTKWEILTVDEWFNSVVEIQ